MIALWDDRALGVVKNTGIPMLPAPMSMWQSMRLRLSQMICGNALMEADRRQLRGQFPAAHETRRELLELEG